MLHSRPPVVRPALTRGWPGTELVPGVVERGHYSDAVLPGQRVSLDDRYEDARVFEAPVGTVYWRG